MKRFFAKYALTALAAATAVAVTLSLIAFFSNNTGLLENILGTVASPFRAVSASAARWVDGQIRFAREFDALQEENRTLRVQIAEMEEQLRQAQKDSEENARLRELLELREQRRDLGELESAMVVERRGSNWTDALILSKGTSSGIEVGDCAVTEEGDLVGVITDAGWNWSTLLTVVDTEFAVGARVFRTRETAVALGDFSLMREGRLKLAYLPAGTSLIAGDLVVTSGDGGYYPGGLVIGSVEELVVDDSGLSQYAVVAPAARLAELEQVFVIKTFEMVE